MGRPARDWTESTVRPGLNRSGRGDRVGVLVAGVHVGPDRPLTEGVFDQLIRVADPAPAIRVLVVIDGAPADAGRLEVAAGALDRLGDPRRECRDVFGIGRGAECPHRRGCRVGVGRGDQHPFGGNSGLLPGDGLGPVEQLAGHHAAIDHHDRQPRRAVVEDHASGPDRVVQPRGLGFQKSAVDDDREFPRRDLDRGGAARNSRFPPRVARPPGPLRAGKRYEARKARITQHEDRRKNTSHEILSIRCKRCSFGRMASRLGPPCRGDRRDRLTVDDTRHRAPGKGLAVGPASAGRRCRNCARRRNASVPRGGCTCWSRGSSRCRSGCSRWS